MELCGPSFEEATSKIIEQKIQHIIIAPYFLFHGMHIKKDIPEIIEKLREQYPDVTFTFAAPMGFEPEIAEVVLKRALEAK